jgi:hypothetical protein
MALRILHNRSSQTWAVVRGVPSVAFASLFEPRRFEPHTEGDHMFRNSQKLQRRSS